MKKLRSVLLFVLFIPGLLRAEEVKPKAPTGEMGVGPEVVLLLKDLASDDEEVKIGAIRKLAKTGDQRLESFFELYRQGSVYNWPDEDLKLIEILRKIKRLLRKSI